MSVRPIWTGSISFGLVNIPVKLHAASQRQRFSFHLLHEKDMGRIRYRRVCEEEDREVPWDEIVKGHEYAKGQYVTVTDEDLESIDIGLSRTVDIVQFVEQQEVDPVFFDRPYFLEPSKGAGRAYALLREALRRSEKIGIARVVLRDREYLAAVRVRDDVITLDTMRFAAELRDPSALDLPSGAEAKLPAKQVELALSLVDQLAGPWEPEKHQDRYREAMSRLIDRKLEGAPLPRPEKPARTGKVVDLADVLRRSLEQGKPAEGRVEAPRRSAARTKRSTSKRSSKRAGGGKSRGRAAKRTKTSRKAS